MNGKCTASDGLLPDPKNKISLNPFVHTLELTSTYEKIKAGLLTVIILPIRLCVIMCLLIAAWLIACVGLYGITEEELQEKPLTGWRRVGRSAATKLIRSMMFVIGFHWLHVKGKLATKDEAPVIVTSPHSTFFDILPVVYMGAPSPVTRVENLSIPLFGKLINYTQPVYVWREDPNSRQKTIQQIIARAKSKLNWSQVLIFPEGTCTNRSCLITFKPGAFYPGVPVQPVLLRYPNKLDTLTWTWEGPGALKLMWLTLVQPHSYCEIEFLPVYHPNEEEKKRPKTVCSECQEAHG
uniref:Phospholipid/glycerol acyltransferase domain-containing protein n=1 Tax=Clastoptera arizonana TaxID=38151 RepID=A0A1B6DYU8_9HEMI